jgi:hypothetical protein
LIAFTASGNMHQCRCWLVSWMIWNWTIVQFQLIHDTSRQQHWCILPYAVNGVTCSWWWAKTSPGTCTAD